MQDILQNNISNINKTVKYILMGLIIVISLKYIPNEQLKIKEILMIGMIGSISLALLDMISPSISISKKAMNEVKSQLLE
jgi:hypothetical protein